MKHNRAYYYTGMLLTQLYLLAGCHSSDMSTTTLSAEVSSSSDSLIGGCSGTRGTGQELQNPPMLYSEDQLIDTQLKAETVDKCINGKTLPLKSYLDANAGIDERPVGPAYIMEVQTPKGPQLKITFTNKLDPNWKEGKDYECDNANGHEGHEGHGDGTASDIEFCTNLHTHGFHVSPRGSMDPAEVQSDYVFISISPATQPVRYEFDVPNDHAPGTHWLHAHLHGSTAPQVKNGMAGALILRGELDKTLANEYKISLEKGNDRIMLLQQMQDADSKPLCEGSIKTSINGQCQPVIYAEAGQIERWRFIHTGVSSSLNLHLVDEQGTVIPLNEFARDGITMEGIQQQSRILMFPGYRSDVLVKFPTCASYPCTLHLIDGETTAKESLLGLAEAANEVASVIIRQSGQEMAMPPSKIFKNPYPFLCPPADFDNCAKGFENKYVYFATDKNTGAQTINGKVYPDTDTQQLKLNNTNTWKLYIGDKQDQQTGPNHPFHIHVNPFQVNEKVGDNYFSYWKDTLIVNSINNYGLENAITVVSKYETFDGKFVLHCHNLNHEDAGMMMDVVINK